MSVLLEDNSLKHQLAALQKKVTRLESELKRTHARLQVLEGKAGVSRQPAFAKHGEVVREGEDVQCSVS